MTPIISSKKILQLSCALILPASAFAVVEWKGVQFGGFASQGYLQSTGDNDYFGETSEGTFDFREYALNASWAKGKFRLGAQIFGQKLGRYGNDEIVLDWATIDYQHASWLGLRAGRVKTPRGLYNESLDVDSVRPFVLLPQSVYDARLRDFNASFDGVMLFGNIGIGSLGSVDYRVYGGDIPIAIDSGAADYFNTGLSARNLEMGMDSVVGGTVFWNTPIDGLRTGYSFSRFNELSSTREATLGGSTLQYQKTGDAYNRHLVSLEYLMGDWTFATEAGVEESTYTISGFGPEFSYDALITYYYLSAAYRVNDWLEIGGYFSKSRDTQSTNPVLKQGDYAFSMRFDVWKDIVLKLEAHYLDQAGKIFSTTTHPQPLADRDTSWMLFAAKATYTF